MAVAMNAYNTLKLPCQKSIKVDSQKYTKQKRLGKVIWDLICVTGKLVKHSINTRNL